MDCIIHYKNLSTYTLKELTDHNIERINMAKEKRLRIGGKNAHYQCNLIPDNLTPGIQKIHSECYKTFTSIIGNQKYKEENDIERRQSSRLSSPVSTSLTPAWTYPKECKLCLKYRVQHNRKKYEPYAIVTYAAEQTLKAAAKSKNENLFNEIQNLDLIAKEFKVHKHCYQNFTKGYATSAREDTNEKAIANQESCYDKGNFEEVKQFVESQIIGLGKAVSMKTIHEIYDLGVGDSRYRAKLKLRLQEHFKEQISFLTPKTKSTEIVISNSCLDASAINYDKLQTVKVAASYIREDILNKYKNHKEMEWPPLFKELAREREDRSFQLLTILLETIICQGIHSASPPQNLERVVESLAQDIIAAVTRGKHIQEKQFLLGLGLHNLTGKRKVIDILHKLGHCLSYNTVCEVETAQAECALEASKSSNILPLKSASQEKPVFTHFWVDNFDLLVDSLRGGGSINTTHLMAFQENQPHCEQNTNTITVPRRECRRLFYEDVALEIQPVNVYKEPKAVKSCKIWYSKDQENYFNKMYIIWVYARKQNQFNQVVPSFKGWHLKQRAVTQIYKTVETYLPPITSKVTEFSTVQKYFAYLQSLAESVNMPYVNITLDVGAAINAYKTVWCFPDRYGNIMIHLGAFHFLKENFQILGSIVNGSGFDDVIYQSGLCTSGSLKGVISGSHYNRAWSIHSAFSEALERLLMTRYLVEKNPNIPDCLSSYCLDAKAISAGDYVIESSTNFIDDFEKYRAEVASGSIGKTPQYWMIYLNLMRMQSLGQSAVHENDLDLLICTWKAFIPFYFAMNKFNYARYGSYYVHTLVNVEELYPGMKEYLKIGGISAQGQANHSVRTATDQRGEQTINKDAKTSGGIKSFASSNINVLKWCLNRPHQARNYIALKEFAGINKSTECYKPLRSSDIANSESNVKKIIEVMENEYLNPFSPAIDPEELYNLSSGVPKKSGVQEMLNIKENGIKIANEFLEKRIVNQEKLFHDRIPKVKIHSFQDTAIKIKRQGSDKIVHANRDVLSKLLCLSTQHGKLIDFENVFKFSLYPYPLSMALPDGSKRETSKSKLLEEILPTIENSSFSDINVVKEQSGFVIDMISQLRVCLVPVPETFEEIALKFLNLLPKGYSRVDIVADL